MNRPRASYSLNSTSSSHISNALQSSVDSYSIAPPHSAGRPRNRYHEVGIVAKTQVASLIYLRTSKVSRSGSQAFLAIGRRNLVYIPCRPAPALRGPRAAAIVQYLGVDMPDLAKAEVLVDSWGLEGQEVLSLLSLLKAASDQPEPRVSGSASFTTEYQRLRSCVLTGAKLDLSDLWMSISGGFLASTIPRRRCLLSVTVVMART